MTGGLTAITKGSPERVPASTEDVTISPLAAISIVHPDSTFTGTNTGLCAPPKAAITFKPRSCLKDLTIYIATCGSTMLIRGEKSYKL